MSDYNHDRADRTTPIVVTPRVMPKSNGKWGEFSKYLSSRELSASLAKANGWYPSVAAGDIHPRIVIPAQSAITGNVFWQARYIGTRFDIKRYQSPAGARIDSIIVVYPDSVPKDVVITEGPPCALASAGEGCLGISLMGSKPNSLVLDYVAKRSQGLNTIVLSDRDALDCAVVIVQSLLERGIIAKVVQPPEPYKDLADCPKEIRHRVIYGL